MCNIYPINKIANRIPLKFGKIRGHKEQITCFDLEHNFNDENLLVTASNDGIAKIYTLPIEAMILTDDLIQETYQIITTGKISRVFFHPYIANIIVTCSINYEKIASVCYWDYKNDVSQAKIILNDHQDVILDISFLLQVI